LWGIHFSREKLQALGLSLGADVPVFLFGRAAFAEGVGERLRPIELPPAWYLVVEPPAQVSTQEVFASLRLTQPSKIIRMPDFSEGLPLEKRGLCNDLQPGVMKMSPVVAEAMEFLSKLGPARMSGSGACVFAEFRDQHSALKALSQWQKTAGVTTGVTSAMGRAWVAKGLDVHPLSGSPGG
jgi:4-diphosphocytidyl-2-C-methyl-D-erythritol kinase